MDAINTKLLKEAYEVRETSFWKVYMEDISRELTRKRYSLESVPADKLQEHQGYIAALRFILGDSHGEKSSLLDKLIDNFKKDGKSGRTD